MLRLLSFILVLVILVPNVYASTINVTNYGADGSGNESSASSNVAAFAAAFEAANDGDTVLVPAGVYYIDDFIGGFGHSNITLSGYGATLKRVSAADPDGYMYMLATSGADEGSVIEGLTIDGNRSSMDSSVSFGIRNDYTDNLIIRDCTVLNCGSDGIYISGVKSTIVENCNIYNNNRQGIAITDSKGNCIVRNCTFSGNANFGIDIEPNNRHTSNHRVEGCTFDGIGGGLNVFGHSSYCVWNIMVDNCDFINGARLFGNRAINMIAKDCDFAVNTEFSFNNASPSYKGTGTIVFDNCVFNGASWSGNDLLQNGSFDAWTSSMPDGWTVTTSLPDAIEEFPAGAIEGNNALAIDANCPVEIKQTVSVTAGEHYTFGGYFSNSDATPRPSVIVKFLDSSNAVVTEVNPIYTYYNNYDYKLFEKVMGIAKAPAGAVSAQIIIGNATASEDFKSCVDGVFFIEGVGMNEDLAASQEQVYRFDFGPSGNEPHIGYTMVDETTEYGYDANTGLTYGIYNNHSWMETLAEDKSSWHTRMSPSDLALTYLKFPDEEPWGVAGFELELPDGDYYVTVGGGNPAWDATLRMYIEGQVYSGTVNSENMRILDIAPEDPGYTPLTWQEITDINSNAPVTSSGYIKTFGGSNQHPEYWDYAQILYLKRQIITVEDGRLTICGAKLSNEEAYHLNFVEVAKVPTLTCEDIWNQSRGLKADVNHDCYVDFKDLSLIAQGWLE